jgi:hypothetical protein
VTPFGLAPGEQEARRTRGFDLAFAGQTFHCLLLNFMTAAFNWPSLRILPRLTASSISLRWRWSRRVALVAKRAMSRAMSAFDGSSLSTAVGAAGSAGAPGPAGAIGA